MIFSHGVNILINTKRTKSEVNTVMNEDAPRKKNRAVGLNEKKNKNKHLVFAN